MPNSERGVDVSPFRPFRNQVDMQPGASKLDSTAKICSSNRKIRNLVSQPVYIALYGFDTFYAYLFPGA